MGSKQDFAIYRPKNEISDMHIKSTMGEYWRNIT